MRSVHLAFVVVCLAPLPAALAGNPLAGGIQLVWEDTAPARAPLAYSVEVHPAGRLVAVGSTGSDPLVYRMTSDTPQATFELLPLRMEDNLGNAGNVVFSSDGTQLYVGGDPRGIALYKVGEGAEWPPLEFLPYPISRYTFLVPSPRSEFLLCCKPRGPAMVTLLSRNPESGHLGARQSFQTPAETLKELNARNPELPPDVPYPSAAEVPQLTSLENVLIAPDGRYAFTPSGVGALIVFRRDPRKKELQHVMSYQDPEVARQRATSLDNARCAVFRTGPGANAHDLFVAGTGNLAWFNWDAVREELTPHQWWVDDDSTLSHKSRLPCLDNVRDICLSKNGRFLFLAQEFSAALGVLEIVEEDIKYVGAINDGDFVKLAGADTNRARHLKVSPDGKYLYSTYSNCPLRVHELDGRYWK